MHELEQKMIEFGAIDTAVENIHIDEWFENATIAFIGKGNIGTVVCNFRDCFEISLKHDQTYTKGKNKDGSLDYKYFIQDIEITENEGIYIFKISAWPLDGEIICKKIYLDIEN